MQDIYTILSKHFLQETSQTEEQQVAKFKKNNETEYKLLSELWKRGDINVKDFDTQKAWQLIKNKRNAEVKGFGKTIPLFQKISRIAAVAAILLVGTFSVYYFFNLNFNNNIIVEQATNTEKGKLVLLSDGSKVWLNENATLNYPKEFDKDVRTVNLKGEAFFEIAKNKNKPFIVTTSNSETRVLGTSFNINSEKENTEVTVTTGKVKVSNSKNNNVIITPGFSAKIIAGNVEKFETKNPNYLSWKTGMFLFKETSLQDVINDLNSFYKKKIIIKGELKDCNFTAEFDNTKLEEVVEILSLTCSLTIIENAENYVIE